MTPPTWRTVLAGSAAGLALGLGAGYKLRGPGPPRVEVKTRDLTAEERASLTRTITVQGPERVVRGPERVIERWRSLPATSSPVPGCPPCPGGEEHVRETVRGPVEETKGPTSTATEAAGLARSATERTEAREVTPTASAPRWALSGGLGVDLHGNLTPRIGGGVRLLGPVWLDLQVAPTRPEAEALLRVEW